MAKFKGVVCDNCDNTISKGDAFWRVRGVNRTAKEVATLDLCKPCAGELFGDNVKELKSRPRKATAPAKPTGAPAKPAQAKAG